MGMLADAAVEGLMSRWGSGWRLIDENWRVSASSRAGLEAMVGEADGRDVDAECVCLFEVEETRFGCAERSPHWFYRSRVSRTGSIFYSRHRSESLNCCVALAMHEKDQCEDSGGDPSFPGFTEEASIVKKNVPYLSI